MSVGVFGKLLAAIRQAQGYNHDDPWANGARQAELINEARFETPSPSVISRLRFEQTLPRPTQSHPPQGRTGIRRYYASHRQEHYTQQHNHNETKANDSRGALQRDDGNAKDDDTLALQTPNTMPKETNKRHRTLSTRNPPAREAQNQ